MNLQNYRKEMFPINFLFLTTKGIGNSARIGNLRVLVVTQKLFSFDNCFTECTGTYPYASATQRVDVSLINTWHAYCCTQGEGCCNYDMIIVPPHAERGMLQLCQDYYTIARR
jgi:hypothetical protein